MPQFRYERLQERLANISVFLAIIVIIIASLVLTGWAFNIHALKLPVRGLTAMPPVTAVCFILSAIAFLLLVVKRPKQTEESLKQSEEQVETIFKAAPDAVIVINEKGHVIKWNPKAEHLLGWSQEEAIGKPLTQTIIPERYRESHQKGLQRFLQTGEGHVLGKTVEIQALRKDNTELDIALSISPATVDGKFLFVGFIRDITEQKKSEESLKESEQKFQKAFQASAAGITITRLSDSVFLDVNDAFTKMTGYTKKELIGHTSSELGLIVNMEKREQLSKQLMEHGAVKNFEIEVRSKSGKIVEVLSSVETIMLSREKYAINVIYDITDRKHTEALILKQKQYIQDFIDSMSTMCARVATDGTMMLVNNTAMLASGLPMEELLRTNFLQGRWWTYDLQVHTRVCDAFTKACNGIPINYDENIFVFGRVLPVNFSLTPIFNKENQVDYIVAEGRDISALKQTEAALQTANKELESFSYSVSHDLRSPLRIIDGYTEILISDYAPQMDDEAARLLGIIKTNARRMGQLIDDLLNLSRLGRKELLVQQIDMTWLVESVIQEQTVTNTNHVLVQVGKLEPASCDNNLIRQVWINLISNAFKYSRVKQKPEIQINSQKTNNEITYSIKDNGAGFDMRYADKLFGVFQRLHKMTEYEGTGVGLALVQQIVTRHGGRVWAEAEVDKGATFYFTLPAN
jgi:PAS domain S-box-containing protein